MFRFEHIELLLTLLTVPLVGAVIYFFYKKQKGQWNRIGKKSKRSQFVIGQPNQLNKWHIGIVFIILTLTGIAVANPQYSKADASVEIESSDVFVALDISRSMDATDMKPNRLERAKILASDIIQKLDGNRVGIILFAGEAYMHMPLTTDIASAISFLETANTSLAPTQGTAIGASIQMALRSFNEEIESGKAIIILSDGEDHEADIESAIDDAKDQNVRIFTVAVGTNEGAYIPAEGDSYLFDDQGKPVKSKVNVTMLEDIASDSRAIFYNLNQENNIAQSIMKNVDELEKISTQEASVRSFQSYYQYLLLPALLLLIGRLFFLLKRKNNVVRRT